MPDRYGEPRDPEPIDVDTRQATQAAAREALHQSQTDEQTTRQARLEAIQACDLCDQDGYRNRHVCDHTDRTQTAARGIAAVRAALNTKRQPPQTNPENPGESHSGHQTTPI